MDTKNSQLGVKGGKIMEPIEAEAKKKRVQGGKTTTELILSAYVGGNEDIFPKILQLHVPLGSKVADVTYGKGVFWNNVPKGAYELLPTDVKTGVDCRYLPYVNGSIDCEVLDPPYAEGFFRHSEKQSGALSGSHNPFRERYGNGRLQITNPEGPKYYEVVLDLYFKAGQEAERVLREGGIFIVKCQDQVSACKQRLLHVDLINYYESLGFYTKDLFVVVRTNRPSVSRIVTQVHARKNHSYFLVFVKKCLQLHRREEKGQLDKEVSEAK
jgi:hypothetical protein